MFDSQTSEKTSSFSSHFNKIDSCCEPSYDRNQFYMNLTSERDFVYYENLHWSRDKY